MFALIIESKEALSGSSIMTRKGEKMWVLDSEWGPTSQSVSTYDNMYGKNYVPPNLLTFRTKEAAEKFARKWCGRPWYCKPNGKFEVVEMQRKYKQVADGYEIVRAAK